MARTAQFSPPFRARSVDGRGHTATPRPASARAFLRSHPYGRAVRLIDEILDRRRLSDRYDEQLWDFAGSLAKRPLEQITDDALQVRLDQIEQNIEYLDTGFVGRDQLPPERGWITT
jgi:hypothetical protein